MTTLTHPHRRGRRNRTGWAALLVTAMVSVTLGVAPAVATPTVPAPTDPEAPVVSSVSSEPVTAESVPTDSTFSAAGLCSGHLAPLLSMKMAMPMLSGLGDNPPDCERGAASAQGAQGSESDPPEDESEPSEERMRELQRQYGMEGCQEVAGFNDRCPSMVSEVRERENEKDFGRFQIWEQSPDGQMVYGVGWELHFTDVREYAVANYRTVVVAFRASGEIAWEQRMEVTDGPPISLSNSPANARVSNDGSRLFVTGANHTTGQLTDDGWIVALDTATGNIDWMQPIAPLLDPTYGVAGALGPGVAFARGLVVSPDDKQVFLSVDAFWWKEWAATGNTRGEAWHVGLDASSGSKTWARQVDVDIAGLPPWDRDYLVISPDGSRLFSQVNLYKNDWAKPGFLTLALDSSNGDIVWENMHRYPGDANGPNGQLGPTGLVLSPDGAQLYSLMIEYHGPRIAIQSAGTFVVLAFDAATGSSIWTKEYRPTQTGCPEALMRHLSYEPTHAMSPSGDLLYFSATAGHWGENCNMTPGDLADVEFGAAIFAVDTATGDVAWSSYQRDVPGEGQICGFWDACGIALAPGPEGGDDGSQLFLVTAHADLYSSPYLGVISLDGVSGVKLWHARYLDTYNDGASSIGSGTGLVSPDGLHLTVPIMEYSETRGWTHPDYSASRAALFCCALQLLRYDVSAVEGSRP